MLVVVIVRHLPQDIVVQQDQIQFLQEQQQLHQQVEVVEQDLLHVVVMVDQEEVVLNTQDNLPIKVQEILLQ